MSVLKTIPEELIAAASQLEGLATSLTTQTAGAAAPTTAVAPAAADSVSTLQSAVYSSYGSWYQSDRGRGPSGSAADRLHPGDQLEQLHGFRGVQRSRRPGSVLRHRERVQQHRHLPRWPRQQPRWQPVRHVQQRGQLDQLREWQLGLGHVGLPRYGGRRPDPVRRPGQPGRHAGDSAAVAGAADVGQISPMGVGGMGMGGRHGRYADGRASARRPWSARCQRHRAGRGTSHRWQPRVPLRPSRLAGPARHRAPARRLQPCPACRVRVLGGVPPWVHRATASSPSSCRSRPPSRQRAPTRTDTKRQAELGQRNGYTCIEFAAFPPEINSGLLYSGAGSGPLMAAGTAYNNLAAELSTAATSWESIVSNTDHGELDGSGFGGCRSSNRTARGLARPNRGRTRGRGRPGLRVGGRLRSGIHRNRAAAGNRGKQGDASRAGRDELLGHQHAGDRRQRGPVRRDVGPGRGHDVHLLGRLGGRHGPAAADACVVYRKPGDRGGRDGRRYSPALWSAAFPILTAERAEPDQLGGRLRTAPCSTPTSSSRSV